MKTISPLIVCLALLGGLSAGPRAFGAGSSQPKSTRPNVLFISVDDLRPELGTYGSTVAHSPRLDALAARGVRFDRAYCQQAVCSPSRTSLLTGRRPDTTRVYDLTTNFRDTIPDVVTLPQYFKNHGYFAASFGKTYHGGLDDAKSWSVPAFESGVPHGDSGGKTGIETEKVDAPSRRAARSWRMVPDAQEKNLVDARVVRTALQAMREHRDKPFFLSVGIRKPHLVFEAPKRFYDLYPLEKIPTPEQVPLAQPSFLTPDSGELRSYSDIPEHGPIDAEKQRELVRGYLACVSFADDLVGRLLDGLRDLGLVDNTIVIVWGDHGYHLGEHGHWTKHTDFEIATRVPLLLAGPGVARGSASAALVELVDVYPTLVELAGLPMPEGLEGTSFAAQGRDPARPGKPAAFSQYPRGELMGYTMRTGRYRYTEWVKAGEPGTEPRYRELYDETTDPKEMKNLADGEIADVPLEADLSKVLHAGFPHSLIAR